MVALRRERSNTSWFKQSLDDWLTSKKKVSKVRYIIGVNVITRKMLSIGEVNVPNGGTDKTYTTTSNVQKSFRLEINHAHLVLDATKKFGYIWN